jgi:hypothetical protein
VLGVVQPRPGLATVIEIGDRFRHARFGAPEQTHHLFSSEMPPGPGPGGSAHARERAHVHDPFDVRPPDGLAQDPETP